MLHSQYKICQLFECRNRIVDNQRFTCEFIMAYPFFAT